MNTLSARRKELETAISDLESSLKELKNKLRHEQEKEQHQAVEDLEKHLGDVDHLYQYLKNYCGYVLNELRSSDRDPS